MLNQRKTELFLLFANILNHGLSIGVPDLQLMVYDEHLTVSISLLIEHFSLTPLHPGVSARAVAPAANFASDNQAPIVSFLDVPFMTALSFGANDHQVRFVETVVIIRVFPSIFHNFHVPPTNRARPRN